MIILPVVKFNSVPLMLLKRIARYNCYYICIFHFYHRKVHIINSLQTDARGLVYADIGASFNQRSNQRSIAGIDIAADRPVEYAQINHTLSTTCYSSVLQHKGNDRPVEGGVTMIVTIVQLI